MSAIHNDVISITNLLTDSKPFDLQYAARDLETLQPLPYQGGSVTFDFQSITSKWTEWNNAWLSVPITITPQAGAFSQSPLVAFKGSYLSLFRGVEIKTSSGQTLVSELNGSLPFSTHLRLMLENNNDWYLGTAPALGFSKDRVPLGVRSGLTTKAAIQNPRTAYYSAAPTGAANNFSSICNVGFMERNVSLLDSTVGVDGSYTADKSAGFSTTLTVPLRYITSFFSQLDFPLINCRLQITFHFNTAGSVSSYQPLCMGTKNGNAVETGTAPVLNLTAGLQPLLYYYAVRFPSPQAELVAKKSLAGIKKTIVFTQTDIVSSFTNITSTSSFQHSVATAVNAPKRVWAMVYPAGSVNAANWPNPLVTGSENSLTAVNVQINGTRYLSNDLNTLPEQYAALCSAMSPAGMNGEGNKMITYSDFCKTCRLLCLDISRSGNKMLDPNQPVSILVTGNPTTAVASDIVYLIEKEMRVVLTFGAGPIQIEIGPNAV